MRAVKVEVLKLIEVFVSQADDLQDVANNFCPPLFEPVLVDYRQSIPTARNTEVLQLFTTIVERLKDHVNVAMNGTMVEQILSPLFACTLEMIAQNYTDFPEHRLKFFQLIKVLNQYGFQQLFSLGGPEDQKNVVNSIVWAFKHTERNIAETGLEIMEQLLKNVVQSPPAFAQQFYGLYYLSLLQDVLFVLTDRLHKSGFALHSVILQHMFAIVQKGLIQVPLGPGASDNQFFLHQYVSNMIATAFPNVGKVVVEQFVAGLSDPSKDQAAFKVHLRDFLIRLKEFSADGDNDQLFIQEREEEQLRLQQLTMEQRAAIPGLEKGIDQDL